MVIYKRISAFGQLETLCDSRWDVIGNLVKFIIDNNKFGEFDDYMTNEFPSGCSECEFDDYCCSEANNIINHLK